MGVGEVLKTGLRSVVDRGTQKAESYRSSQIFWFDPKKNKRFGSCRRSYFWELKGVPHSDVMGYDSSFRIELGNRIHELFGESLVEAFKDGDVEVLQEQKVQFQLDNLLRYNLTGHYDAALKSKETGKIGNIIEFKSTFGRGFKMIPKEEHVIQVMLYALSFIATDDDNFNANLLNGDWRKVSFSGLPKVHLLYVSREGGAMKEFMLTPSKVGGSSVVVYDAEKRATTGIMWPGLYTELEKLNQSVEMSDISCPPDRDYEGKANVHRNNLTTTSDWRCRYCPYKTKCYSLVGG